MYTYTTSSKYFNIMKLEIYRYFCYVKLDLRHFLLVAVLILPSNHLRRYRIFLRKINLLYTLQGTVIGQRRRG